MRIVPAFYALLRNQESSTQSELVDRLQSSITNLVLAADEDVCPHDLPRRAIHIDTVPQGPFFLGTTLCLVDVHFAPFALRLPRVLAPLSGWPEPVLGTRWYHWLEALESDAHVRATTSSRELYAETTELLVRHSVSR